MSLDLLTICSPLGSLCLAAGDAVMEQGRISDLDHSLPPPAQQL